jgi:hypothetical protein
VRSSDWAKAIARPVRHAKAIIRQMLHFCAERVRTSAYEIRVARADEGRFDSSRSGLVDVTAMFSPDFSEEADPAS